MQKTTIQEVEALKVDFELLWCSKVQALTELRRTKMSQSDVAFLTGRSLKTIQRFERYKSKDPELVYLYRVILK
jgi:hypothetical protein